MEDVAGEEEEGCEDKDCRCLWLGGFGLARDGGEGLPTLEDMATEIEPLERSMMGMSMARGLSFKDHGGCACWKVRDSCLNALFIFCWLGVLVRLSGIASERR